MANRWLELLYYGRLMKELVFPRSCAVCRAAIYQGCVCDTCRKNYLLNRQLRFKPREEYLAGQAEALVEDVLDSLLLLYKYDGVYRDALHQAKFSADFSWLPLLREEAELALPAAKQRWLRQFDIAVCIPTSRERYEQRGYDVPQEIFAALFNHGSGCVYREDILERSRQTAPLFELEPEQRRTELAGCFVVKKPAAVRGKRVLLCDDIFTTGSTLAEAALELRRQGASQVHGLTLAAARLNWR